MPRLSTLTAKQRFTLEYHDYLEEVIAEALREHVIFSRLPERDRMAAAHCAATHALLAVRSSSIETLELAKGGA